MLLLSGCSQFSPQTTEHNYVPSDGAQLDLGDVGVRNALFVIASPAEAEGAATASAEPTTDENAPAAFVGTLTNAGEEDVEVSLDLGSESTTVTVPASGTVQIAADKETTWQVPQVGGIAGETVEVIVTAGDQQAALQVPVLDGTLAEYSTLAPSSESSPTGSPTGSGTGTPTSGATGTATQQDSETETETTSTAGN